jgi:hypothetical protein
MSTTYGNLYLRRDVEANRTGFTFAIGEPFYTTDMHELWIGDGATAGGIFVSSKTISQVGADQTPGAVGSLAINPTQNFASYLQRILPTAGAGAYVFTLNLYVAKALPGATVRVYVELPASANPTVQIKDQTGLILLSTITSPNGGTAAAYSWNDFQIGPDGAFHLTARGWL